MSHVFIFQIWGRYHEKWDSCRHFSSPPPPPQQPQQTLWTVSNYMLIISHRDVNHTNTGTFSTKHANIYENAEEEKKEMFIWLKSSLSYAPSDDRCVTACVTRHREGAPESNNHIPCIFDFFFFGWFHSVWDIVCYKIVLFFTTKTLFLSVICSITDTNNSSPSRDET